MSKENSQAQEHALVAIINSVIDFNIARDKKWYRIPVQSVEKWLRDSWPPRYLAFYQTKVFADEAFSVRYYAKVIKVQKKRRIQLIPSEINHPRSESLYYQLILSDLFELPAPVLSRRLRRIVFIPTTYQKLMSASEVNDLFKGSSLEERLWAKLKDVRINAERQDLVTYGKQNYFLDFAVYCADGQLDIETDGDHWHANPEGAAKDNLRDNQLTSSGWRVLRFTGQQICEQMESYCLPTIEKSINKLGGIVISNALPRQMKLGSPQLDFFD